MASKFSIPYLVFDIRKFEGAGITQPGAWTNDIRLVTEDQPRMTYQEGPRWRLFFQTEIILTADQYDLVNDADKDTRFEIVIRDTRTGTHLNLNPFMGLFDKIDAKPYHRNREFRVTPKPNDAYTSIYENYEDEINWLDLGVFPRKALLDGANAIQVYVMGSSTMLTIAGGHTFESEVLNSDIDHITLQDEHHFLTTEIHIGLVGLGAADGEYTRPYSIQQTRYEQVGGNYQLRLEVNTDDTSLKKLYVRNPDGTEDYATEYTRVPWIGGVEGGFISVYPLTGNTTTPVGQITFAHAFFRFLTNESEWDGHPTVELDQEFGSDEIALTRAVALPRYTNLPWTNCMRIGSESSATDQGLGLRSGSDTTGEEYHAYYPRTNNDYGTTETQLWPYNISAWSSYSLWIAKTPEFEAFLETGGFVIINNVYSISKVINALLESAGSQATYEATALSSQLLFDGSVTDGEFGVNRARGDWYVAPTSNITNSSYDQAASVSNITLKQVVEDKTKLLNGDWMIDGAGRLRIEHNVFYNRGGTYDPAGRITLDADLPTAAGNIPPTRDVGQEEHDKTLLPGTLNFETDSTASDNFKPRSITIEGFNVDSERSEDVRLEAMSADAQGALLLQNASDRSPLIVMELIFTLVSIDGNTVHVVRMAPVTVADIPNFNGPAYDRTGTNMRLSWPALQEAYWTKGLPGDTATINGKTRPTTDPAPTFITEIPMPARGFDPAGLVKANGDLYTIKEADIDIVNDTVDLKLLR